MSVCVYNMCLCMHANVCIRFTYARTYILYICMCVNKHVLVHIAVIVNSLRRILTTTESVCVLT